MSLPAAVLAGVGLALGVVVVAALILPVGLELRLGGAAPRAALSWAFGAVRVDLLAPRRSREPARVRRKPRPRASANRRRRVLRALRSPGLAAAALRLVARTVRATHPRDVQLSGRFGFDDPADTGQIWALMAGPLSAALAGPAAAAGISMSLSPDFQGRALALEGGGRFTVIPGQLLAVVLAFVFSRGPRRAAWIMATGGER